MSRIFARAFGYREFFDEDRIKEWVDTRLQEMAGDPSNVSVAGRKVWRAMLIFSTSKQQSWIVTDSQRTCLVLDDIRKEYPMSPILLRSEDVAPIRWRTDREPEAGVIYFGERDRGWYYSKKLFADRDPAEAITHFLTQATATSTA